MNLEAKELWAFLRALEKDPRDVVTRRVFADWLEEHDEPEEADRQRSWSVERYDAEQRLRAGADRYASGDYEGMLRGALEGRYCFSDDFYTELTNDDRFWEDVVLVTGAELGDDHRENTSFRCAC